MDPRLPAPVAYVPYDPATGSYVGPDGKHYTQADLAHPGNKSWQSMLVPATPALADTKAGVDAWGRAEAANAGELIPGRVGSSAGLVRSG